LERLIEFCAGRDTHRKPVVASKRLQQVGVVPLGEIVVRDIGILAEQPFDQITIVVKNEDDGLESARSSWLIS